MAAPPRAPQVGTPRPLGPARLRPAHPGWDPSPPRPPLPLGPAHPAATGGAAPPTPAPPTPRASGGAAPPAQPAPRARTRQAASPQFLTGGGCGSAALQVLTFWRRRSAPALRGRRLWEQPTLEGLSAAPRRSRRPRSGGHEARPRPPAFARRAAAAMSRGPEEVNRLTENTYRVSEPGTARDLGALRAGGPGPGGGARPGVRGGPRPTEDRGSESGAGRSGEAPRRLAVVAGEGRGEEGTLSGNSLPRAPPGAGDALLAPHFTALRAGRAAGAGVGSVPSPGAASSCPAAPRGRAGVAAAPELPGTREQRRVAARGDGGERRAGCASGGRRGLPAAAPALGDPAARRAPSPSAGTRRVLGEVPRRRTSPPGRRSRSPLSHFL